MCKCGTNGIEDVSVLLCALGWLIFISLQFVMLEGYVVVSDDEFKYLNSSWYPHFQSLKIKCDSKIISPLMSLLSYLVLLCKWVIPIWKIANNIPTYQFIGVDNVTTIEHSSYMPNVSRSLISSKIFIAQYWTLVTLLHMCNLLENQSRTIYKQGNHPRFVATLCNMWNVWFVLARKQTIFLWR